MEEQGQTWLIERQESIHRDLNKLAQQQKLKQKQKQQLEQQRKEFTPSSTSSSSSSLNNQSQNSKENGVTHSNGNGNGNGNGNSSSYIPGYNVAPPLQPTPLLIPPPNGYGNGPGHNYYDNQNPSAFNSGESLESLLESGTNVVNDNGRNDNNDKTSATNSYYPGPKSILIRRDSSAYGSIHSSVRSTSGADFIIDPQYQQHGMNRPRIIRFQVVIWNIGKLDVVAGTVPMTFRVSLFWNTLDDDDDDILVDGDDNTGNNNHNKAASNTTDDGATTTSVNSIHVWKMHGRQKAFQQELKDVPTKAIEVPPLSIMNACTFQIIGSPDVGMLNESTKLMRWTAMYRATIIQENLRVDQFPHDSHGIHLKLGILSHRGKGKTWDRRYWKLGLASAEDTAHSTRIPHGLIVDQASIPGFRHNRERGLDFSFRELDHGIFDAHAPGESMDQYLKVSLNILRESGYYDKNIVPILALMNVVAISVLTFDDTEFFYRALITLNIAFVQMGMRMTADNHLPMVDYEIRLQRILNEFFVVLMILVLEAMFVYVLTTYYNYSTQLTKVFDWITGIAAFLHNVRLTLMYYRSRRLAKERLQQGWSLDDPTTSQRKQL